MFLQEVLEEGEGKRKAWAEADLPGLEQVLQEDLRQKM